MIRTGVVGATGYAGEELVGLLAGHGGAELVSLSAMVDREADFSDMHPRFKKKVSLVCRNLDVDDVAERCELVFLALPHTVSFKVVPELLKKGRRVIDLSADYRLPADIYGRWYTEHADRGNIGRAVYGLPELNRDRIRAAELVANPGCYPTSVLLALLPIARSVAGAGHDVVIDSKSGVTGAGRKAAIQLLFGEAGENLKCYKANAHQHMPEMEHVLEQAAGKRIRLHFAPHLLPIRRGILSTIYIPHRGLPPAEELHAIYSDYYRSEPFVRVRSAGQLPEIQDVARTNFCDIGLTVAGGMLIIVSVIDNLLKGAAGQAVQNMNLMYGLEETAGLGRV